MNAHERLRLYLEQRRELGETELVLDALPVDSVLKMIGAPPGKGTSAQASSASQVPATPTTAKAAKAGPALNANVAASEPVAVTPGTLTPSDPPPRFDNTVTTDWRAALSDLKPGSSQKPAEAAAPSAKANVHATTRASDDAKKNTSVERGVKTSAPGNGRIDTGVAATAADFPVWLRDLGLPFGLTADAPSEASTSAAANAAASIDDLATVIASCRACSLGELATNPVPGEGNILADFVCVGEAPGQSEDETGRPFVGAAGQLLTKILAAIQLQRDDVFICNVLKHRPPGNRNPQPDEIRACTPYLTRQLSLVQPKVILALGTFAAQTLLNTTTPLGKLRGQIHRYHGVPLIVTYHPAALLRNDSWKRPTWDDVKLARRILDAARSSGSASPAI